MTNTELLEEWIEKSGKKKKFLAAKVGLSLAGFRNCCINKAEFTGRQIRILSKELGISNPKTIEQIFLLEK